MEDAQIFGGSDGLDETSPRGLAARYRPDGQDVGHEVRLFASVWQVAPCIAHHDRVAPLCAIVAAGDAGQDGRARRVDDGVAPDQRTARHLEGMEGNKVRRPVRDEADDVLLVGVLLHGVEERLQRCLLDPRYGVAADDAPEDALGPVEEARPTDREALQAR